MTGGRAGDGIMYVTAGGSVMFNGVKETFERATVIENHVARDATEQEMEAYEAREALIKEATDAGSRVSLRPDPTTGKHFVIMKYGRMYLKKGAVYTPGTVTAIDEKELKNDPFVATYTLNQLPTDLKEPVGVYVGYPGEFRVKSKQAVYRVAFNYGYYLMDDSHLEVDGNVFAI
jgi:hypothetical protein